MENNILNGENSENLNQENSSFFDEKVSSSNSNEENIPQLRFPEFKGFWYSKKMGELGTFTKGATLSKADISEEGSPFILYGELYTTYNEVAYEIIRKTSATAPQECYSIEGDVIIPTSGETPEEIATSTCVMKPNVILGGDLNIFRSDIVDGRITSYIINHKINKTIAKIAQGKSVVHIKADDLKKLKIYFPEKKEQDKIIKFLDLLNLKIEKQRQLVESLKKYKRGYFKNIISKISKRKYFIKDVVSEFNEKTTISNQYPILSSTLSGIRLQENYFNKQAASENNIGYKIVPKGYFTYRSMSDTGVFRFNCQNLIEKGIVSPAYPVFSLNEEHNKIYFELIINESEHIKQQLLTAKEGGTRYALSFSKFESLMIELPDLSIQNKIANQIFLFNLIYEKEDTLLTKLIALKQGLLQQMFI